MNSREQNNEQILNVWDVEINQTLQSNYNEGQNLQHVTWSEMELRRKWMTEICQQSYLEFTASTIINM